MRTLIASGLATETWRHHHFRTRLMWRVMRKRRNLAELTSAELRHLLAKLASQGRPIGDYTATINLWRRLQDLPPVGQCFPS